MTSDMCDNTSNHTGKSVSGCDPEQGGDRRNVYERSVMTQTASIAIYHAQCIATFCLIVVIGVQRWEKLTNQC